MDDETGTFWAHMGALRRMLVSVIVVIAIGFACALFFSEDILSVLAKPLHKSPFHHQEIRKERIVNPGPINRVYTADHPAAFSTGTQEIGPKTYLIPPGGYVEVERAVDLDSLVMLSPIEGMMTSFKISFWVGFVGSSPIWLYFVLQFIIPALHEHERQAIAPFLTLSLIFLAIGFLFAFFITIPLANQYLLTFNQNLGQNLWSLSNYLDYSLFLLLANAFAFELSLVLLALVHFNILGAETMAAKRRHMIVVAFILGAILTPPDVLTQFMLAIPLILLYEFAILYARFRKYIVQRDTKRDMPTV